MLESLFKLNLQAEASNFIIKEALVFYWELCEIFKNTFLTKHLWTTATVSYGNHLVIEEI